MNDTPYTFWNNRFTNAGDDYLFGTNPNGFLVSQKDLLKPGMKVLSVADGEGRNGVFMASLGVDVLAIDFSPVALAKSQKLATEKGVSLVTQEVDLYNWHWPQATFDAVAAIFIQFSSAADRPGVFANIKKALKPGGLLLLQGYRPEQLNYGTGGPPVAENMYTEEILRDGFSDMEITHLHSHDDEVDEGPGHSGMSALIDMVAWKR
ncbi:MAG TPA: class I SAM-dependent methyltransferase [Rhodospirillales bacterium]|nr:class I SAM-dependent methyltransferase [Rhodospirillales bacterium]